MQRAALFKGIISKNEKTSFVILDFMPETDLGVIYEAFTGDRKLVSEIKHVEHLVFNKIGFKHHLATGLSNNLEVMVSCKCFPLNVFLTLSCHQHHCVNIARCVIFFS